MKTIQSVELRKNYDTYMKRALSGEKIYITYRGKRALVLSADEQAEKKSNVDSMLAAAQKIQDSMDPAGLERLRSLPKEDLRREHHEHRINKNVHKR